MVKVFYSPKYVGSSHAFDTTRKAGWIAESLDASPISGLCLAEPPSLTREQLLNVHAGTYVTAVETGSPDSLAQSQGFTWDVGLWPMVLSSNGGAVAAALAALKEGVSGSLSSGLHHARRDRGAGFCTFNGLAIAAREARAAGAQSVLILDLDAHCGGGTSSLIQGDPGIWQLDVSVSPFDQYQPSAQVWLELVTRGTDYLPTIERLLSEMDRRNLRFDLCIYNAGMDLFEHCEIGGISGITFEVLQRRENLVFEWCRARSLPIAFVLAGGYIGTYFDQAKLVALHRLTLQCAVNYQSMTVRQ
jgi:acetoin utilization deacetylase AcuC-like enzyme